MDNSNHLMSEFSLEPLKHSFLFNYNFIRKLKKKLYWNASTGLRASLS